MRPVIALLSDFGTRDHYAGTMKGVMIGICPTSRSSTSRTTSRRTMCSRARCSSRRAYRYFPAGTIFLAVVDPGVGSARRGLAAEAGDYRFVAPDNGLLTAVFHEPPAQARRRADRAPVRAADGEPDVRGARPLCAGRRVAGQGHSALGARARRHELPPARPSAARRRTRRGWRGRRARRSLRESRHQHRPPHLRGLRRRPPGDLTRRRAPPSPASSPPTPTSAPEKSAGSSAAPTISSSPPTAASAADRDGRHARRGRRGHAQPQS